jgi:hypothetical protein
MSRTLLTARHELPDLIERGQVAALRCPVYRAGAIVSPVGGTVTVLDAAGEVVTTAPVQVLGGVATHTVLGPVTAALPYGEGWRVRWSLSFHGEGDYTFENEAMLVRVSPSPVVTEADLYRRASSLDPAGHAPITALDDYAAYIDEAWVMISHRLIGEGRRPWLVMSPSSLRECHALLALGLIFEDLMTRLNVAFGEQAAMYRRQYEEAWGRLRFSYDEDQDGQPDGNRSGSSVMWLTSTRGRTGEGAYRARSHRRAARPD